MAKTITSAFQGRLTLGDVLRMLVNDGIVEKALAEKLYRDRRLDRSNIHPLVVIGEQQWKDRTDNNKPLTVESLTAWLASGRGWNAYTSTHSNWMSAQLLRSYRKPTRNGSRSCR